MIHVIPDCSNGRKTSAKHNKHNNNNNNNNNIQEFYSALTLAIRHTWGTTRLEKYNKSIQQYIHLRHININHPEQLLTSRKIFKRNMKKTHESFLLLDSVALLLRKHVFCHPRIRNLEEDIISKNIKLFCCCWTQ